MRHDQQTGLGRLGILRDFARAFEQQLGHHRMISDRLGIFPDLAVGSFCDAAIQLKLTRDNRLREITFADEIGHDVNLANFRRIKQKERVAQTWLLFPERAADICKNFPTPNLRHMRQRRRARIGIHRRAVSDDEKRGI